MKTATAVVQHLLDSDDDLDPKAYLMALRLKRDIVNQLVYNHAVRHTWTHDGGCDRLNITYPKDVPFGVLLRAYGVPPSGTVGISGGSKNYRMSFWWHPGELDTLVNPPNMEEAS